MEKIASTIFSYYNHEMDNSFLMDDWHDGPYAPMALRGITPIGLGLPDEFFMKRDCLGLYCEIEGEDFPKWFHISTFMVKYFFKEGVPDWAQELIKECDERSEEYSTRYQGIRWPTD